MSRKEQNESSFDPQGWMFTFSDLVTLLLTFFVMLLAMQKPAVVKFKEAFGMFSGGGGSGIMTDINSQGVQEFKQMMEQLVNASDIQKAQAELAKMMDLPEADQLGISGALQPGLQVRRETRGTVITLANDLLFGPGGASLSPKAMESISQVAKVLSHSKVPIAVEGHTDSSKPGKGSSFKDNWTLSLARAHSVLLALIDPGGIDPARLRMGALADTRPLVANDSTEHRAMNRRTEIVLLATNQQ